MEGQGEKGGVTGGYSTVPRCQARRGTCCILSFPVWYGLWLGCAILVSVVEGKGHLVVCIC